MRVCRVACQVAVILFALCHQSAVKAGSGAVDLGSKTQLFVDQHLVRQSSGVSFTLHPAAKHPQNPVVRPDRQWEGSCVQLYGTVLYDADERQFKMWYTCLPSDYFARAATCYAVSRDGLRWEKPPVGTIRSPSGKPHNAVADCVLASVTKDSRDADSRRRYKMLCFVDDRGFVTKVSPDGLRWEDESPGPIVPISYVEDVVTGFWHDKLNRHVAFPRLMYPVAGRSRRCFWLATSGDFKSWSKPELVFAPDARDDAGSLARVEQVRKLLDVPDNPNVMRTEFYGVGAYPAESCTIAFPWVFTVNANDRFGNQDGPIEIQLAASRDLVHWSRPFRLPCIARSSLDQWDCGMMTTAARAIDVGDEVWLYYGAMSYTHGDPRGYGKKGKPGLPKYQSAIGLARWPRDRFVSVDGPSEGGSLTTVPITFTGSKLEINCRTKPGGEVQVELLDAAGKPIDRFATSDRTGGDALRHVVTFGGSSNVAPLAGKPICLRFRLKSAELYSFAFRP